MKIISENESEQRYDFYVEYKKYLESKNLEGYQLNDILIEIKKDIRKAKLEKINKHRK